MRTKYIFVFPALLILFAGCSRMTDIEECGPKHIVISAFTEASESKATLVNEGQNVFWEPGDEINIFYGAATGRFKSMATDISASTKFTGDLEITENDSDLFWAVYPFKEDNEYDGASIIMTVPPIQKATTRSFDKAAFITIAANTGHKLRFFNVCGGVAISVTQPNVKKVVFRGNNGEHLAGKARVKFNDMGKPVIADILQGESFIELSAPEGQFFEIGEWYYMAALPQVLGNGFTMEFYGSEKTEWKHETPVTIKRAVWGRLAKIDNDSIISFEDANFKAYCVNMFDKNGDGEISVKEAQGVRNIDVNTDNITSLEGIRSFYNLEYISARGSGARYKRNDTSLETEGNVSNLPVPEICTSVASGQLQSVDFSGLKELKYIDISRNNNVSEILYNGCDNLTSLWCNYCNLTALDVSGLTSLSTLYCYCNQLKGLDLSNNTDLSFLRCYSNSLSSLNVSNNTALSDFWCSYNQLTSLDVHENESLSRLYCHNNLLSSIDVTDNPYLSELLCDNNQLNSLDVSKNTALTRISCAENHLISLDVSKNVLLTSLTCQRNQLSSLELSNNRALQTLWCYDNMITELDINNRDDLRLLHCQNNLLTELDLSNDTALSSLMCENNQISRLDLSNFSALTRVSCEDNVITEIILYNNKSLKTLLCYNNLIQSLDLSSATDLKELWCQKNRINTLILNDNSPLSGLLCDENLLTSLDVSYYPTLTSLSFGNNQISSIDVTNNIALKSLICYGNQLQSLDVSNNISLTMLFCGNNQLSTLDVSNNLCLTNLHCNNNPNLYELWLKSGQTIPSLSYDSFITTIKYK